MDLVEMLFNNAMNAEGGGGGGGVTFPTFTLGENDGYACDMTYAEVKEIWTEQKDADGAMPYHSNLIDFSIILWNVCELVSGETLNDYKDVPETVTEGVAILGALFAEDGNFYVAKTE